MFLKAALKLTLLVVLQICPTLANDCGTPPDMENANYIVSGYSIGKWTYYTCNKGYILYGRNRILCTRDGWTKPSLSCQMIKCGHPPPISNGTVTEGEEWPYGTEASYSCVEGYTLTGQETIHCTDTRSWSHPPPICTANDCGTPPDVENASCIVSGYSIGNWAFYTCNKGYILYGRNRILCTGDGWTKPSLSCQMIKCGHPPPISNGTVTEGEEWPYGTEASYSCVEGYTLTGQETIHCTDTGAWSHPPPICTVVKCPDTPAIENGRISRPSTESWEYGMVADVSCERDYSLIGERKLICKSDGSWSHPFPKCKDVECRLPDFPDNVEMVLAHKYTYKYQEQISFRCKEGYEMDGNSVIVCGENGNFSPPPPTCTQYVKCLLPDFPDNVEMVSVHKFTYKYQEQISFRCKEGYKMDGNSVIVCGENSNFSPPPPTCTQYPIE